MTSYDVARTKKCPICGYVKYIEEPEIYRYKRNRRKQNGNKETLYFCRYRCMREYDRRHDNEVNEAMQKAAVKRHTREREKKEKIQKEKDARIAEIDRLREGKFCKDCLYSNRDQYGFYNCSFNYVTKAYKTACRRYKPKNEERMEYG